MDGCWELVLGNEEKALERLGRAVHVADGTYVAGFLALKQERLQEAARYLGNGHRPRGCAGSGPRWARERFVGPAPGHKMAHAGPHNRL